MTKAATGKLVSTKERPATATAKRAARNKLRKQGGMKKVSFNNRLKNFVLEYVVDNNAARAVVAVGYSAKGAKTRGSKLLARQDVQDLLAIEQRKLAERTGLAAEKVVNRYWETATADPNEICQIWRVCCRYCYGKGHRYQFTAGEVEVKREEWDERLERKAKDNGRTVEEMDDEFDTKGGIGYDFLLPPVSACPECRGLGETKTFIMDTRTLSPQAKLLYDGFKVTQAGLSVTMTSRLDALANVGRALGVFNDKLEVKNPAGTSDYDRMFVQALADLQVDESGIGKGNK